MSLCVHVGALSCEIIALLNPVARMSRQCDNNPENSLECNEDFLVSNRHPHSLAILNTSRHGHRHLISLSSIIIHNFLRWWQATFFLWLAWPWPLHWEQGFLFHVPLPWHRLVKTLVKKSCIGIAISASKPRILEEPPACASHHKRPSGDSFHPCTVAAWTPICNKTISSGGSPVFLVFSNIGRMLPLRFSPLLGPTAITAAACIHHAHVHIFRHLTEITWEKGLSPPNIQFTHPHCSLLETQCNMVFLGPEVELLRPSSLEGYYDQGCLLIGRNFYLAKIDAPCKRISAWPISKYCPEKKTYVAKSTGSLEGGEGPEKLFRVDISPETTLASHPAHRVT